MLSKETKIGNMEISRPTQCQDNQPFMESSAHTHKSWTAVLIKANTSRMGTPQKERLGGDRWSIIMISIN
jgi:hypothetical protein